jgi:hypothetical protein
MSRSRKKVLGFVDRNPFMKTYANRRIRRLKPEALEHAFGAGKSNRTRRYSSSYDICDHKDVYFSKQEVLDGFIKYPIMNQYYKLHNFYTK